jgi:hypothetical protein
MSPRDDLSARDDLKDAETGTRQPGTVVPGSPVSPNSDRGRQVRRIDCSASAEHRATQDQADEDNALTNRLRHDTGRGA